MSVFGWCASGFHCYYEGEWSAPCKGSYRNVVKDIKKRGRKVIETIVVDEIVNCDCPCHRGEPVVEKKPTETKRRKKK